MVMVAVVVTVEEDMGAVLKVHIVVQSKYN
jgi:hypothetical protein